MAIAQRSGRRCRFLGTNGRLGARRDCDSPVYRRARLGRIREGKVPWTFRTGAALPRGNYVASVRALDANGRPSGSTGGTRLKRFSVR